MKNCSICSMESLLFIDPTWRDSGTFLMVSSQSARTNLGRMSVSGVVVTFVEQGVRVLPFHLKNDGRLIVVEKSDDLV